MKYLPVKKTGDKFQPGDCLILRSKILGYTELIQEIHKVQPNGAGCNKTGGALCKDFFDHHRQSHGGGQLKIARHSGIEVGTLHQTDGQNKGTDNTHVDEQIFRPGGIPGHIPAEHQRQQRGNPVHQHPQDVDGVVVEHLVFRNKGSQRLGVFHKGAQCVIVGSHGEKGRTQQKPGDFPPGLFHQQRHDGEHKGVGMEQNRYKHQEVKPDIFPVNGVGNRHQQEENGKALLQGSDVQGVGTQREENQQTEPGMDGIPLQKLDNGKTA